MVGSQSKSFLSSYHLVRRYSLFRSGQYEGIRKKELAETLMLTSLIDAFSILVIYLLMSFSSTGEMSYMKSEIELPKAQTIERLEAHPIIQITDSEYIIEDVGVEASNLVSKLFELKQTVTKQYGEESEFSNVVTVQADKEILYDRLSRVIQACNQVGFSDIKFGVLAN